MKTMIDLKKLSVAVGGTMVVAAKGTTIREVVSKQLQSYLKTYIPKYDKSIITSVELDNVGVFNDDNKISNALTFDAILTLAKPYSYPSVSDDGTGETVLNIVCIERGAFLDGSEASIKPSFTLSKSSVLSLPAFQAVFEKAFNNIYKKAVKKSK